jgi:hypothetical protein
MFSTFENVMTKKYTPLREELTVVETIRYMPKDILEIKKIKDEMVAKYGPDVIIEKHEYTEREWSWRTDSHYEVERTDHLVKCMRPVYSEADRQAMHKEYLKDAIAKFNEKYAARALQEGGSGK